jgi:hypothetical protein
VVDVGVNGEHKAPQRRSFVHRTMEPTSKPHNGVAVKTIAPDRFLSPLLAFALTFTFVSTGTALADIPDQDSGCPLVS